MRWEERKNERERERERKKKKKRRKEEKRNRGDKGSLNLRTESLERDPPDQKHQKKVK